MEFNGIDFGNVSNAAGARNIIGQGYPYQRITKPLFGATWRGARMIYKTVTALPRQGNMPTAEDRMTPREWIPRCIVAKPFKGVALNAVGLTNPGMAHLLTLQRWQCWPEPATISCMAVGDSSADRFREISICLRMLQAEQHRFRAPIKVELNVSCPNTDHDQTTLVNEAVSHLVLLRKLGVPLTVKLNVLASHDSAKGLLEFCDGLVMGNTIPWGQLPDRIPWKALFGAEQSPLTKRGFGGGGLSGAPLRDLHCEWIRRARDLGIRKPIEGCGGILSVADAKRYLDAGASGIQLGSISFLAPWNLQSVIAFANDPATKWSL